MTAHEIEPVTALKERKTLQELEAELKETQLRLEDAEETLRAIQNNEVDALIVDGPQGQQVFTLQGAEQPYRTLMETMSEGALTTTIDGMILYCNQRFSEMIRAPLNRIIGSSFKEIMPSEDWQKLKALLNTCGKEGCRGEYRLTTFEGQEIPVYVSARPLRLQDMESFFLVATDLTGQHTLERQIRQSQKMEAIGTLAGGIAHDFNNILAGMIGFTEMVMEDIAPDSPEHKRLELVLKGGKRGRDLVKQILAFSSQGEQEKKPLAVSEIVEEGLKLLRPTLPSTIEIVSKSLTNDDRIFADLVQMHQVLMNLCTNAAHAMREKGGVLELQISKVGFTEHDPLPFSDMVPGEYVVLTVRDTGTGMTPDILDRIFDPFFTTKKPGEGTGLGLSVIHGIVQRHGGYVAVESEPGKGTTFRVYLPKIEEQAFSEDREAPVATGGNERILFVDDEDMLVELNRQRLTRFGYEVVGTTSSMDALDIFRKDPDVFDLVITDYTMPNLTGMELAAQLLKVKPSIPIILCTGDSQPVTPESAQDAGINALLMKPAGREGLAQTIRNVLDQKTKE